MNTIMVLTFAVVVLLLLALILFYLFLKYKKKDDSIRRELRDNGIYIRVSDKKNLEIKKGLFERFEFIKELSYLYYLNCDNFYMHRESMAKAFSQIAEKDSMRHLCTDIVTVSNLCENGAIQAMALQYKLTPAETRICCFLYWGFKWQQTSTLEGISENAYFIKCCRIRKKFKLSKDEDIPTFIVGFMHSFARL